MIKRFFGSFRWLGVAMCSFLHFAPGLFLIPFGKGGAYLRNASGRFGRDLLWVCGGKSSCVGLDGLDPSQSYIFVGNHQSYVDIFLLLATLHTKKMRTLFMMKKELYVIPFFKTVADQMGLITVEREESRAALKSLLEAAKKVKAGSNLVIFPEGTRSIDGNMQPFKKGAFMLAERTGLPIVPFVITGTMNIHPKGQSYVVPGRCNITYLKPIMPGEITTKELATKIEEMINEQYLKDKAIMDKLWQES